MHFAVMRRHAAIGAMARHLSGVYANHLRRRWGWTGGAFNHYAAMVVDADLYLDDLVIWLHRPPDFSSPGSGLVWTADDAYTKPHSSTWISTHDVLCALGGAGTLAYRWRRSERMAPELVAVLTRGACLRRRGISLDDGAANCDVEQIVRLVASHCQVPYEDLCSPSRRRALGLAKAIAAVLCARRGASIAAVARLFRRSRSTLIEQTEHYRKTRPHRFEHAERMLEPPLHEQRIHGAAAGLSEWGRAGVRDRVPTNPP
jgi:hypothetical protein